MTLFLADVDCWWNSPDCVNSFRVFFHHPFWFIFLVGVFSVNPSCLICLAPSGSLYHWRAWRHLSTRSASYNSLSWRVLVGTCSLGRCSSPGEFHGILNRSILSILIRTEFFRCPLRCTAAQGTYLLYPGTLWNWQAWSSRRRYSFWYSDWICVLAFLTNSYPFYLRRADGDSPVIAQRWWRRRDNFLVFVMRIHHPYYLMVLTCRILFWSKCTMHV